jgi:hypothetical protein
MTHHYLQQQKFFKRLMDNICNQGCLFCGWVDSGENKITEDAIIMNSRKCFEHGQQLKSLRACLLYDQGFAALHWGMPSKLTLLLPEFSNLALQS